MYLRFVRLKLRQDAFAPFRDYYESRILPALAETDGCLYAALLRSNRPSDGSTCDSLTLWRSSEDADAYVDGGLYDELLDGADPYLATATEWSAELPSAEAGLRPPLPDPKVETYPVEVAQEAPDGAETEALYLRIVDHRVEPSRFDELRETWEASVLPALLATPGCRSACLLEGLHGKSQALSVTFWSDEASAVRYEASGRFDALVALVKPYLSGIYQWRLSLTEGGGGRDLRGSDLSVSGFHVVAGRRLGSPRA